jgi:hypothetical protein
VKSIVRRTKSYLRPKVYNRKQVQRNSAQKIDQHFSTLKKIKKRHNDKICYASDRKTIWFETTNKDNYNYFLLTTLFDLKQSTIQDNFSHWTLIWFKTTNINNCFTLTWFETTNKDNYFTLTWFETTNMDNYIPLKTDLIW